MTGQATSATFAFIAAHRMETALWADRLFEFTGTLNSRQMHAQVLVIMEPGA